MPKTALITGGTGGLGAAVTKRLLGDGWRVVVPCIPHKDLQRPEPDAGLELVRVDLFDPDEVGAAVAQAASDSNAPLSGVVNLVGGFHAGQRIHETPVDVFEAQFRLNLRPTYLVTAAALPP